jgi:hypothetical protein
MLKPLLTLLCSCAFTLAYSQEFTYSFSGKLSEDDAIQLKCALSQFPISDYNITLKPTQELGYLVFRWEENPNGDNPNELSLTNIKKTLIEFGLIPLQCNNQLNPQKP